MTGRGQNLISLVPWKSGCGSTDVLIQSGGTIGNIWSGGEGALGVSALVWTATPDRYVEDNVISHFQAIVNDNSGGSDQVRRSKARGCA